MRKKVAPWCSLITRVKRVPGEREIILYDMEIDIKNLSPLFRSYAGDRLVIKGWRSTTRRRFDNRDNETRSSNEESFLRE